MKMRYGLWLISGITVLVGPACSRKPEEAPAAPPPPPPGQVSFAATNRVVPAAEIKLEKDRFVEVDLNRDGMKDLAVLEEAAPVSGAEAETPPSGVTAPKTHRLAVYIRKSDTEYFVCGRIVEVRDAEIIGLAYRKSTLDYIDIVIVNRYKDGTTDVAKYANDGYKLEKVEVTQGI